MRLLTILLLVGFVFTASCSTKRAFTKGEYTEPDRTILLDDRFNESDMKILADGLVGSLLEHPIVSGQGEIPVFFVDRITNSTSEHIDMLSLTDKIKVALIATDKVVFHDVDRRSLLSEEYRYQAESGYVDQSTAKQKGRQIGSDYIISGDLSSIVQEVGNRKVVYYKLTLRATDIETGIISWADDREIKKLYRKRSISL